MKSKGVRLVLKSNFLLKLFHQSAELLYEKNIEEAEDWEAGVYQLASLYFGTLNSHAALEVLYIHQYQHLTYSFQDVFFNDPHFGNKRPEFWKSVDDGCDYCFWMIHYRFQNITWETVSWKYNCLGIANTKHPSLSNIPFL